MEAVSQRVFQSTRPVWGATVVPHASNLCAIIFQSTRPVWGATAPVGDPGGRNRISIHAPRVGRDFHQRGHYAAGSDFNPRAPCGARRGLPGAQMGAGTISIHAPRVGRDLPPPPPFGSFLISIHAPRVGRDDPPGAPVYAASDFNPRAPCGARPLRPHWPPWTHTNFNPRAPCGARRQI